MSVDPRRPLSRLELDALNLTPRCREAYELRQEGLPLREIGARMGVSHQRVHQCITKVEARARYRDQPPLPATLVAPSGSPDPDFDPNDSDSVFEDDDGNPSGPWLERPTPRRAQHRKEERDW